MVKFGWLKPENFRGHTIYFLKKETNWVRYFIDSKNNYTGDAPDKTMAFNFAKILILKQQVDTTEKRKDL